jgi:hypothetical protein
MIRISDDKSVTPRAILVAVTSHESWVCTAPIHSATVIAAMPKKMPT